MGGEKIKKKKMSLGGTGTEWEDLDILEIPEEESGHSGSQNKVLTCFFPS